MAARLSRAAATVLPRHPVRFAYLYGSQVSGRARPDSDVDVAVMLDGSVPPDRFLELAFEIARDLTTACAIGGIEVTVLDDAPLTLRGRVLRSGIVLFSADEPGRVEYASRTLREFTDFDYHASKLDRELLKRTAAGER